MTDLGTLPGGLWSEAHGINDSGQVVGWSVSVTQGNVTTNVFLYDGGTMADLGAGMGYGINANGQVVGQNGSSHAFLYDSETMTDLGTFGGVCSEAHGVNDSGQVVGWFETDRGWKRAFLYDNGKVIDLSGMLVGGMNYAYDINNSGQVVGKSGGGNSYYAYLYDYSHGTMANLNDLIDPDSGWRLITAEAINDSGQIVGYGVSPSGFSHAFLLTPVPEPSPLVLLGMGMVGLLAWIRRRI